MAEHGGEEALFRRLRLRLTVLCIAATGVIVLGMSGAALAVSQIQLTAKAEAAFQSDVNAILYHLRSQTVVDHTWISQTEAGGNLTLYLELSGQPILYAAADGGGRRELVERARAAAWQGYGVDLSLEPDLRCQPDQTAFFFEDGGLARYRAAVAKVPQEKGWIGALVIQSMAEEERELAVQRTAFGAFTLAALVLLALFAWYFTGRAVRPLAESRRRQNEFIAAASHELRSPLAVIHASLSALKDAAPEKAEHFTQLADGECMRMSRLVGDMLALANADSGSWTMYLEDAEPETLLLDVAEGFEHAAREKGVRLAVALPEKALGRFRWDRQRMVQALTVLTDNGLSYTPAGGSLGMGVERAGSGVRFTVADTGPGIPDGEKERVFERFYRTDRARTDREHYGLGLCIAREIISLHGGTIRAEDTPGGGATFVVELPGEGRA